MHFVFMETEIDREHACNLLVLRYADEHVMCMSMHVHLWGMCTVQLETNSNLLTFFDIQQRKTETYIQASSGEYQHVNMVTMSTVAMKLSLAY